MIKNQCFINRKRGGYVSLPDSFYVRYQYKNRKTSGDMPKVFLKLVYKDFLFCSCKSFAHLFPIDYVPEGADIVRPSVLVVEVIGMFPYVKAQNRGALYFRNIHSRVILVRGRGHLQLA